ncbi:protein REGULATOR OF FATTY ACID COMPOSITION 3, chloroplastic [Cryptomeria japonica]|uniref:protein REGULATOR OF FATTY ACID COMPOSITION 3, chloroplastic n=1 Tax=Cryptomeria japonica TaxID=3369 RepID=UPI0027DA3A04|nr:protein REGULATOR OF FATTY ACID COMPOSITION 3, chloroplastic [Cryptomeria japonica]
METLSQTGIRSNFKAVGFTKNEGYRQKQYPMSALTCGSCAAKPVAAFQIYHNVIPRRTSVILMATKSGKNKHSDTPAYKELYEAFPEALLLKKSRKAANKKSQVPDFADEEELVKSLELQFESDMDLETTRHYEIMYLIHEDNANEVEEIVSMVKGFIEERKGKIWRVNDWGMRRLAYKIKKAKKANYILMNFEIGTEHINELKDLLDKDERVIRHLVTKQKEAITEDCPPPPAYRDISTLSDEEAMDDDAYEKDTNEDELEEWEEVIMVDEEDMNGIAEYDDQVEVKSEGKVEGDKEDMEGADKYSDQIEGEKEDWEEEAWDSESTKQKDAKQLIGSS